MVKSPSRDESERELYRSWADTLDRFFDALSEAPATAEEETSEQLKDYHQQVGRDLADFQARLQGIIEKN